jgi:Lrp/AsnC family transcriptional regulator of ectoine degradation
LLDFQVLIEQLLSEELGIDRYIIYVVTREVKLMPPSLSKLWGKKK